MKARSTQPWLVRLTHWVNVPVWVFMALSGLEILSAYPSLGPRGMVYRFYPWNGSPPPAWLRFGDWLAGARHLHFALAWLFVGNGLLYVGYLLLSGEARDRWFLPWRDTKSALTTLRSYLRLREPPAEPALYNGLQRLAYTGASLLAAVIALSGLAIYKPVQLHWLCVPFGGYDGARATHLVALMLLALFFVGHLVMVVLHPRRFPEMITGGPPRE
jgi:thiosulfate reductase cytochrome b subunit